MLCGSSDMGDRCREGLVALMVSGTQRGFEGRGWGESRLGALVARKRGCATRQTDAADWCEAGGAQI